MLQPPRRCPYFLCLLQITGCLVLIRDAVGSNHHNTHGYVITQTHGEGGDIEGGREYCENYDDDDIYTPDTCGGYDKTCCYNHCSSGMCNFFCGSGNISCGTNSGAVCAMKKLSHIFETCKIVDSLPDDFDYGRLTVEPYGDYVSEHGCDEHVFCSYCNHKCKKIMRHYGKLMYGNFEWHNWYVLQGSGPFAMKLLSNVTTICEMIEGDDDLLDDGFNTSDFSLDDDETNSSSMNYSASVSNDDTVTNSSDNIDDSANDDDEKHSESKRGSHSRSKSTSHSRRSSRSGRSSDSKRSSNTNGSVKDDDEKHSNSKSRSHSRSKSTSHAASHSRRSSRSKRSSDSKRSSHNRRRSNNAGQTSIQSNEETSSTTTGLATYFSDGGVPFTKLQLLSGVGIVLVVSLGAVALFIQGFKRATTQSSPGIGGKRYGAV